MECFSLILVFFFSRSFLWTSSTLPHVSLVCTLLILWCYFVIACSEEQSLFLLVLFLLKCGTVERMCVSREESGGGHVDLVPARSVGTPPLLHSVSWPWPVLSVLLLQTVRAQHRWGALPSPAHFSFPRRCGVLLKVFEPLWSDLLLQALWTWRWWTAKGPSLCCGPAAERTATPGTKPTARCRISSPGSRYGWVGGASSWTDESHFSERQLSEPSVRRGECYPLNQWFPTFPFPAAPPTCL